MLRTFVLVIMVAMVPLPEEPQMDPVARDIHALQGTWKIVATESRGSKIRKPSSTPFIFSKDKFAYNNGPGAVYKLDPSKDPKHMDIDEGSGKVCLALYKIDGDILLLAWGPDGSKERPLELKTKQGQNGTYLHTLKRVVE